MTVFVALGANLPSRFGAPRQTCEAALTALERRGLAIVAVSPWYASAAEGPPGQPDYVNGVAAVATALGPADLMTLLHEVETEFGRARGARNAARPLDLDLLDCDGLVAGTGPILPHPRLHGRGFVLQPLADIAPDWRHPVSRRPISALIADLPAAARARRIP